MKTWIEWNIQYTEAMALKLVPELNRNERKQLYKKYVVMNNSHSHTCSGTFNIPVMFNGSNSLVSEQCAAVTPKSVGWFNQKEGNNPMRAYSETYAVAPTAIASINVPSDEAKKIDYLNGRARDIRNTFRDTTIRKMFHFDGQTLPMTYRQLIDAIKNDEFEIDEKRAKRIDARFAEYQNGDESWFDYSAFDGLTFTGFPEPDKDGYAAAQKELKAEYQKVKDAIAILDAETALAAVQAFEEWKPSNAPTLH